MINGEGDMNVLIYDRLSALTYNDAPTGSAENLVSVPVYATLPDESVVPNAEDGGTRQYPAVTFFFMDDISLEGSPLRNQGDIYTLIDEARPELGYEIREPPIFRRLLYQVDLYTQTYQDMVYLSQRLLSRLKREFGALTDSDGTLIYYRLTDVSDLTRDVEEERIYRRAFSYSFDAWVWEDREPKATVGTIEKVHTDIHDQDTEELYDTVIVPDE